MSVYKLHSNARLSTPTRSISVLCAESHVTPTFHIQAEYQVERPCLGTRSSVVSLIESTRRLYREDWTNIFMPHPVRCMLLFVIWLLSLRSGRFLHDINAANKPNATRCGYTRIPIAHHIYIYTCWSCEPNIENVYWTNTNYIKYLSAILYVLF